MRILLVEDDPKTATYLQKGLSENGFIVDLAPNGKEGLFCATNYAYDVVILDIMLPIIDGWNVLSSVREKNKSLPILVLTARDGVFDRVKGLELGADDYLVKPFAFSELLARIFSLLRRGQVIQSPLMMTVDDLEIHLREHKVFRGGQKINLTAKEFSLLTLLAKHQGEILSRTMIIEEVWDMNFDCMTNIVDVMILRLRQKIDKLSSKKLIHCVRGVGYMMEAR